MLNGSRGYYDAARASLVLSRWRGLSMDVAYWFSKAMDLGSSYTNTAYDADSRIGRSQSEFETHKDLKARSEFDQPHSFIWRASYAWRNWTVSGVTLLKSGTPFNVVTGSDGPGFGNVDGSGNDRPNLLNPSVLGRTIGNPDTAASLAAEIGLCVPRPGCGGRQPGPQRLPQGRHPECERGVFKIVGPAPGDAPYLARRINQPVQHPAIQRPGGRIVVAEFRPDHQHFERWPRLPIYRAVRMVKPGKLAPGSRD